MDIVKQLLIINEQDQSDSIASFRFASGKCDVVYKNSPKVYSYHAENVKLLNLQKAIDPNSVICKVCDNVIGGIDQILDFGEYLRIVRSGKKAVSYRKYDVQLERNCLSNENSKNLMDYFRKTASAISLVTEAGINLLRRQYEKIEGVSENTILAHYFAPSLPLKQKDVPDILIYPFGLNQSQKSAVENAFSSRISIIQGPPGTGKTQTILNIVANVILQGQTIAVVSNNNSAISNVIEKLEKQGVSFISALLGCADNKKNFLKEQSGCYPDMHDWALGDESKLRLYENVKQLSNELGEMFKAKNRIAKITQKLLAIKPEQHYFNEYCLSLEYEQSSMPSVSHLSSRKLLTLWLECEQLEESGRSFGLWQKLVHVFRYGRSSLSLYKKPFRTVIPYLQQQYYIKKSQELLTKKESLAMKLKDYHFDAKMDELAKASMQLFKAELAQRYNKGGARKCFENRDFWANSAEFNREYPLILSTTHSIKGTLSTEHLYNYLIVDEASQVDLATGVLALSCAQNMVVVGDLKQLPNVLTDNDKKTVDEIWDHYAFDKVYQFSCHSLLSSATAVWLDVPMVLLREHYRCHPKIAGFFNQKFYDGQLIVMTEDHEESNILIMYCTVKGQHARGHLNQRQIDVIKQEVIPRLIQEGVHNIGIIAPYRDQVAAMRKELGDQYEIATVHRFQGREKEAIILATVDDIISEFVDDPQFLNVAVSRAMRNLAIVIADDPKNRDGNLGDLAKYIEYNNFETVHSMIFSVFDLLYKEYSEQRKIFLQKHKRVSEYDSENLMYTVIESVLNEEEFKKLDCVLHVSLVSLVRNYDNLSPEETAYTRNLLTHIDFLIFNKMNKMPVLAVEVDGTSFHMPGSKQETRDVLKNSIMKKCGIPLLRIRTNESCERDRLKAELRAAVLLNFSISSSAED